MDKVEKEEEKAPFTDSISHIYHKKDPCLLVHVMVKCVKLDQPGSLIRLNCCCLLTSLFSHNDFLIDAFSPLKTRIQTEVTTIHAPNNKNREKKDCRAISHSNTFILRQQ